MKTYRWLLNTWKHAQPHSLLEKCKPKPQRGVTSRGWNGCLQKLCKQQTLEAGEEREPFCTVGGNVNWWRFLKKKKTRNKTSTWPNNPTTEHISWGDKNWKDTGAPTFMAGTWKPPGCPRTDEQSAGAHRCSGRHSATKGCVLSQCQCGRWS